MHCYYTHICICVCIYIYMCIPEYIRYDLLSLNNFYVCFQGRPFDALPWGRLFLQLQLPAFLGCP